MKFVENQEPDETLDLADCIENPDKCNRSNSCLTKGIWKEATKAMYDKLNSTSLPEMIVADKNR
jgi:DNA-binding IscR family transcriptional regulator